jgi:delta-aminolevulinic acid dehydratase/porphobilinogen synthase
MTNPSNKLHSLNSFPRIRMRRNRMKNFSRRLVSENTISTDDLIYPIFITFGNNKKEPIESMPGINRIYFFFRYSRNCIFSNDTTKFKKF